MEPARPITRRHRRFAPLLSLVALAVLLLTVLFFFTLLPSPAPPITWLTQAEMTNHLVHLQSSRRLAPCSISRLVPPDPAGSRRAWQ